MDAISYAQGTLKDNARVVALLGVAEQLAKLAKKLEDGGDITKAEGEQVKPVSGDLLFGYDNNERIRRLNIVYAEVQN